MFIELLSITVLYCAFGTNSVYGQGYYPNGQQGYYPNGQQGYYPNGQQGNYPNQPYYPNPQAFNPNEQGLINGPGSPNSPNEQHRSIVGKVLRMKSGVLESLADKADEWKANMMHVIQGSGKAVKDNLGKFGHSLAETAQTTNQAVNSGFDAGQAAVGTIYTGSTMGPKMISDALRNSFAQKNGGIGYNGYPNQNNGYPPAGTFYGGYPSPIQNSGYQAGVAQNNAGYPNLQSQNNGYQAAGTSYAGYPIQNGGYQAGGAQNNGGYQVLPGQTGNNQLLRGPQNGQIIQGNPSPAVPEWEFIDAITGIKRPILEVEARELITASQAQI